MAISVATNMGIRTNNNSESLKNLAFLADVYVHLKKRQRKKEGEA
jgi:hypothetical protein